MKCRYQTSSSMKKQKANGMKPRIVLASSSKLFGTSIETTSSVSAKPNAASLNPSRRETLPPRQRNSPPPPPPACHQLLAYHPLRLARRCVTCPSLYNVVPGGSCAAPRSQRLH